MEEILHHLIWPKHIMNFNHLNWLVTELWPINNMQSFGSKHLRREDLTAKEDGLRRHLDGLFPLGINFSRFEGF